MEVVEGGLIRHAENRMARLLRFGGGCLREARGSGDRNVPTPYLVKAKELAANRLGIGVRSNV